MTDLEFDIIDELYFVQSFQIVHKELELDPIVLRDELKALIQKGWVKCFESGASDEVVFTEALDFDKHYLEYHYLATKEGLLAHNSR